MNRLLAVGSTTKMPITGHEFGMLALRLPEVVESSHMGHADFRVRGKIFATLGAPRDGWGMVKLTPEQQKRWMEMAPGAFVPAAGAWGRSGSTLVALDQVDAEVVEDALGEAWGNVSSR